MYVELTAENIEKFKLDVVCDKTTEYLLAKAAEADSEGFVMGVELELSEGAKMTFKGVVIKTKGDPSLLRHNHLNEGVYGNCPACGTTTEQLLAEVVPEPEPLYLGNLAKKDPPETEG